MYGKDVLSFELEPHATIGSCDATLLCLPFAPFSALQTNLY